jgi:hypothetical protein
MPGTIIAAAIYGASATGWYVAATAFAINMVASAIVARVFAPDRPTLDGGYAAENPGSRATVPPASDNKLPVVYGSAFVGGSIVDMSITSNNATIYYVIALSEVTNTETGGTPDTFTFGNIYYGGKRVVFDGTDLTKVVALYDESTFLSDTTVNGLINIYLYRNGINSPTNNESIRPCLYMAVIKINEQLRFCNCQTSIQCFSKHSRSGHNTLSDYKLKI